MSIRNQLRVAKGVLGQMTGAFLAKEVRETIASFEKPEWQNERVMLSEQIIWMTAAEVKATFGPKYASHPVVIQQMIATYTGRAVRHALAEAGLNANALSPTQIVDVSSITDKAERDAFVRLTAN
ncbi:hypothetical protein D3C75_327450 [compost metagenome]